MSRLAYQEFSKDEKGYLEYLIRIILDDHEFCIDAEWAYENPHIIVLFMADFYAVIDMDNNRAEEGLVWREKFLEYADLQDFDLNRPCSILEMIIGVCDRLVFRVGYDIEHHFVDILENLEIDCEKTIDEVKESCRKLLERDIWYSGYGGQFPLKKAKKHQKHVEIWYQMMAYIIEKYLNKDEVAKKVAKWPILKIKVGSDFASLRL